MSQSKDDSEFMTVGEVARMYRVSKMTIYRLINRGQVDAVQIGRGYRMHRDAVAQIPRHVTTGETARHNRAACE